MSNIDEIMGAIGRHGDDCIRDADSASESFEGLRELIAAALADARREGAEQMRAEAGHGLKVGSALYARPVPAQAVPMSDERIDAIAELVIKGMPDGICGFLRTWGYQQFARALLEVCAWHYRAQAVPDGWRLVNAGALAMVVNALRRDAEDGRPVRGEMADELIAAAPEHKA